MEQVQPHADKTHSGQQVPKRKPYKRPQFIVFGNIAELTQAQSTSGTDAGGG